MKREEIIIAMDSLLCAKGSLLDAQQREEMLQLIIVARETPTVEEGEEPEIDMRLLALYKVLQLKIYDSSDEINGFKIAGKTMWLTPAERANYTLTIQAAKKAGVDSVPFAGAVLPVDTALAALEAIDVYALQCVSVTNAHEAAILELGSTSDIERYDFTVGYPTMLEF